MTLNKNNYQDFMIVDKNGSIIYADMSNPQYFGMNSGDMKGKKIEDVFPDRGDDYPAIVVARTGKENNGYKINLTTRDGNTIERIGYAYPIYIGEDPIAAVEFSDFIYDIEHIKDIENRRDDLIFRQNNTKYKIDSIISEDSQMAEVKQKIMKYADSESSVLIFGETGTGKELIAEAIHNRSKRYTRKFISLNCGTIPENLAESIIFGATEGSFTGAEDKPGIFMEADGGTLFLDEVNSLPVEVQTKLSHAIESKVIRRLGATEEIPLDVRIIAATNEEPITLIKEGRMIEDFYHRISTFYIKVPRLVERGKDVLLLTDYFTNYFNSLMHSNIKPFSKEIRDVFMKYDWPGNVRELRNVIEGAFVFAESDDVKLSDIPGYIVNSVEGGISVRGSNKCMLDNSFGLKKYGLMIEKQLIEKACEISEGNLTEAAGVLGISKQLLNYKITKIRESEVC